MTDNHTTPSLYTMRELRELMHGSGLSYRQVAELLGMTFSSLKGRLTKNSTPSYAWEKRFLRAIGRKTQ